jgi:hypothetical protein
LTASPGVCKGSLFAKSSMLLGFDEDRTIVITAKPQRVLMWENNSMGVLGPADAHVFWAFRHAADLGDLTFKAGAFTEIFEPSLDPVWVKGDQDTGDTDGDNAVGIIVTRPDSQHKIAGIIVDFGAPSGNVREEFYVIGTKPSNARIVEIKRRVTL